MTDNIPSRSNPAVTELVLYARNSPDCHTRLAAGVRAKLMRPSFMARLVLEVTNDAARAYRREFGNADAQIFTAHDLLLAAAELYEWYLQEYGENRES